MVQRDWESTSARHRPRGLLEGYRPIPGTFDEAFEPDGTVRSAIEAVIDRIDDLPHYEFKKRKELADETFLRHGVTFSVYSDEARASSASSPST